MRFTDQNIWLFAGVRTPFGRFCGDLRGYTGIGLGALVLSELLSRSRTSPDEVDELYVGTAMVEGGQSVPARQIALGAQLPETTPTLTVDRACCSGMTAVGLASKAIVLGGGRVAAVGIESMSNTPRLLTAPRWATKGDVEVADPLLIRSPISGGTPIAKYTGQVAIEHGVGRDAQDEWSIRSHERYFEAFKAGFYADEIMRVETPGGFRDMDEPPRSDTSLERLARLSTVYGSPTVTPGNAPGLNDGAAAVLLSSDEGLMHAEVPRVRIAAYCQIAGAPTAAAYLPGQAIAQVIEECSLKLEDIGVIEINEAFAATALVSTKVLAGDDQGRVRAIRAITNCKGGAVAIGHPTGASGTRIVLTAARRLEDEAKRWGVAAICGGFGQTDAVLLERMN